MANNDFQNLIRDRKEWVESSRKNKFDFDLLLSGQYSDPSHFLYEILQNAEDAGAKSILFKLLNDRLEIFHDGRDFEYKDVEAITGIGISTKKDEPNAIGKFGIGFKSVFAITRTPLIKSGEFHFKIQEFVVPEEIINPQEETILRTKIVLPFDHALRDSKKLFEMIESRLKKLDLTTLLFLSNIKEIRWEILSENGNYSKSSQPIKNNEWCKRVILSSPLNGSENSEEYLVVEQPVKTEKQTLKIEIAYRLERDKKGDKSIVASRQSKLVVFFQTERNTGLKFLIQGPYRTTPNRENIPLDDEWNKSIIMDTAKLVAESIPVIKEIGLLDLDFLKILPLSREYCHDAIYSAIYESVKGKFLSGEKLLPVSKGVYATPKDCALPRGSVVTKLIHGEDLKFLFGRSHWLDANITLYKNANLRDYLFNELDVEEIDFDDFCRKITAEFLQTKNDEWMIEFYKTLLNHLSVWNYSYHPLRRKPIIRLADNTHTEPFDATGTRLQVYLPSGHASQYKTVKPILAQNEEALKFFKQLGLDEPDFFSEIYEFILPEFNRHPVTMNLEQYYEFFGKFLNAYKQDRSPKSEKLLKDLRDLPIVLCFSMEQHLESYLLDPVSVYLKTQELTEYFKGFPSAYFVSEELYEKFNKKDLESFLLAIGCEDKPRRKRLQSLSLTHEEKQELRYPVSGYDHTCDLESFDYDYEGLDNFLKDITKEKSQLLWKFLLKNLSKSGGDFFKGKYNWKFRKECSAPFDAYFLKKLKNCEWLAHKSEKMARPSDIALSDLCEGYDVKESTLVDRLTKILGLKLEGIKDIEERTGGKFVSRERYAKLCETERQEAEIEKEKLLEEQQQEWEPEVSAEDAEVSIEETMPIPVSSPDLRGQHEKNHQTPKEPEQKDYSEDESAHESGRLKKIGDWGEEYVLKSLKLKYNNDYVWESTGHTYTNHTKDHKAIEIVWLGDTGKGYDILVVEDGVEIEYIEVKSKTGEAGEMLEITGTQWEFARKLYDEGEGEKYSIYIVNNAGSEQAYIKTIRNPVKLWKEGMLYAHPVRIKL